MYVRRPTKELKNFASKPIIELDKLELQETFCRTADGKEERCVIQPFIKDESNQSDIELPGVCKVTFNNILPRVYKFKELLGSGTEGAICLFTNVENSSQPIVIKYIPNTNLQKLQDEAEKNKFHYQIGGCTVWGTIGAIVMKYNPGQGLLKVNFQNWDEYVDFGYEFTRQLDELNAHIAHRDLHAGNILYAANKPLFVDFGSAEWLMGENQDVPYDLADKRDLEKQLIAKKPPGDEKTEMVAAQTRFIIGRIINKPLSITKESFEFLRHQRQEKLLGKPLDVKKAPAMHFFKRPEENENWISEQFSLLLNDGTIASIRVISNNQMEFTIRDKITKKILRQFAIDIKSLLSFIQLPPQKKVFAPISNVPPLIVHINHQQYAFAFPAVRTGICMYDAKENASIKFGKREFILAMATDSTQNLVVSYADKTIAIYNPHTGQLKNEFAIASSSEAMAILNNDQIAVCGNPFLDMIHVYSPDGKLVSTLRKEYEGETRAMVALDETHLAVSSKDQVNIYDMERESCIARLVIANVTSPCALKLIGVDWMKQQKTSFTR